MVSKRKKYFSLFLAFVILIWPFLAFRVKGVKASVLFQDGFEQDLSLWDINRPDTIVQTGELKHEGSKALRINHDGLNWGSNASRRFSTPVGGRVAVWIYDDLSNPSAYVYLSVSNDDYTSGTSIGIRPQTSTQNYVYCPTENQSGCMDTGKRRTKGWHQFKVFVTPKGTYGKIDGESFSYLPANEVNGAVNVNFTQLQRVNLGIMNGTSGYFYFDDVYIDSYPPPPSDTEIAMSFVNLFLTTYPTIDVTNIDRMIKAREGDFCSVDTQPCPDGSGKSPHWHYNEQLFHVYGALLQTAGMHTVNYLKNNQASGLQKAIEIVTYIDGEYDRWKQNKSGSLVGNSLTTVSWIIWPSLPTNLQQSIRSHMLAEGEYFKNVYQPYSEYIGNSSGEENSWPGTYLNTLSLAFKDLPQAQSWAERAKFFAFHSLSKGESYGGFTSRTIYDDNLFDNHDYHPHPTYGMGTAATLASMENLSKKVIGTAPTEFRHNVLPVWQRLKEYIDFRNFSYKGGEISRRGRDINGDGQPDYTPSGNVFYPSGQNDWGDDALIPYWYRVMKEVYGDNAVSDPETGFSTTDLSRHSMEYLYYTHSGYVWKYDPPNSQLTEMLIDNGIDLNRTSYKWWRNSQWAWSYAYLVLIFDPNFTFPSTKEYSRPAYCQSAVISGSKLFPGGSLNITSTANTSNIKTFSYAFYNLDNLYGPGNPKPIYFEPNTHFIKTVTPSNPTNTASITVSFGEFDKPDLNWNSQKPRRIQVNTYFTDLQGNLSQADPKCVVQFEKELPGDANGDGVIDGQDYIIWLNHYNQTTDNGIGDGDFNEDGKVDGLDYVIWLNNYQG